METRNSESSKIPHKCSNMPAAWEEVSFVLDRNPAFRLAGVRQGPADGERWLLLHGFLDCASTWDRLIQEGGLEGGCVVALDFLGHGKSSHAIDGIYYFMDHVADVASVVRQLGWDSASFNLLGHSMGGAVACCYAGAFPSQVKHLVLIEALGPWTRSAEEFPATFAQTINRQPSANRRVFQTIEEAAKRRSEGNFVNHLPIDAATALIQRNITQTGDGGYTWTTDSRLMTPARVTLHEDYVLAYLRCIRAHTLLIIARDGLFHQLWDTLRGISPFSIVGRLFVALIQLYLWFRVVILRDEKSKKHLAGIRWVAQFAVRKKNVANFTEIVMLSGGHHPQLTEPVQVADIIRKWRQQQSVSLTKANLHHNHHSHTHKTM